MRYIFTETQLTKIVENIFDEGRSTLTQSQFLDNLKSKIGEEKFNKFNFDKLKYEKNDKKVLVGCKVHNDYDFGTPYKGYFTITPNNLLKGRGCPICGTKIKPKEDFINKGKEIHGDKYLYDKIDYTGLKNDVLVGCKVHSDYDFGTPYKGYFSVKAEDFIRNKSPKGCPICATEKMDSTKKNNFLEKANNVHSNVNGENRYEYGDFDYKDNKTKIKIYNKPKPLGCGHEPFWQTPEKHVKGQGCPICNESKGERRIKRYLESKNIDFISQKTFSDCKGICKLLPFDFFLPDYNTVIEYDGILHYEPVFGNERLSQIQNSDSVKTNYCKENNIRLIRIPYTDYNNIYSILSFL
jgi:hypothetical protein